MTMGQIALAVIGGLLCICQAGTLFILKDFRERIMRVESLLMKQAEGK